MSEEQFVNPKQYAHTLRPFDRLVMKQLEALAEQQKSMLEAIISMFILSAIGIGLCLWLINQ